MGRTDDRQRADIQSEPAGGAARSGDTERGPAAPRDAVERALATSAAGWERVSSTARIVFSSVILARFLMVGVGEDGGTARAWLELPAIGGALAFSAWALARVRRGAPAGVLVASVACDALAGFVSLASNVVSPWPGYRGILVTPDLGVVPLLIIAAGMRMSPRIALFGAALNGALACVLVAMDATRNATVVSVSTAAFPIILVVTAAGIGVAIAARARALALETATRAVAAERADRSLRALLRDHHDLRSWVSSALLNVDLLERAVGEEGGEVRRLAGAVRADMSELRAAMLDGGERARAAVLASHDVAACDAVAAVDAAIARTRARFATVAFERHGAPRADVRVAGGRASLERAIGNLLANASEGDGARGATRVDVEVRREADRVLIAVRDDGPGFSDDALRAPPGAASATSKVEGVGVGLFLVSEVALASGGALERANETPGACVTLALPAE